MNLKQRLNTIAKNNQPTDLTKPLRTRLGLPATHTKRYKAAQIAAETESACLYATGLITSILIACALFSALPVK